MIRFTLLGLGVGALYAIGALGIVCIHRGSRVLNLAHGGFATWGAYIFVRLRDDSDVPAALAAAAAVGAVAIGGAVIFLVAVAPIRARTPLIKMVMTVGILAVLQALAAKAFGNESELVRSSLPQDSVTIFGARIGVDRIILLIGAVLITGLLAVWSQYGRLQLATRAMAENEEGAVALGCSPMVLGALNWALGSGLAALAGVALVPILGLGPISLTYIVVPALAAALLGRFDSYGLALLGGLVIGVAESLTTYYVDTPGWSAAAPFVLVIIALALQRQKGGNRLAASIALPVSSGRFRAIPAIVAFVGVMALIQYASNAWLDATVTSLAYALLGLSLVVLIGYANQISLAQMAIAGIGAFVAGKLAIEWDVPFVIAPLVGAAAGAVAGLFAGLPALRVRGINLAVVTLGMGLATERIIFSNPEYTGGYSGMQVPTPTILGHDVDLARNAMRYALVCLFWVVLGAGAVLWLRRSALGRQLLAMRTNERAAASLGVDVARSKLAAFTISSALAGLAGVLLAYRNSPLTFFTFTFAESQNLVIVAVIAGVGGIIGGLQAGTLVAGGLIYHLVSDVDFFSSNYALIFGIGLVLTVLLNPNGAMAERRRSTVALPMPAASPSTRTPARLQVSDVVVNYGGVRAVDHVGLTVEPGEIVGLIGPNGAGKTTFLDAVGGFVGTRQGKVILGDVDLSHRPPHVRARHGMARVFQAVELFEDLTVRQNLVVGAEAAGEHGASLPPPAIEAIERFGLAGQLDERPGELSMAQRRLVGVARALAADPSVLLLDEPGAGLSITESAELGRELRLLARKLGLGVLVVDHDMSLITAACDRVVVMSQGARLVEGSPAEIMADEGVRSAYLGELPVVTDTIDDVVSQLASDGDLSVLPARTEGR